MPPLRVLVSGLGVVLLWASAFPAIRVAAPELGVVGLSFIRLVVAAVALLAVAPLTRGRRPARRDLPLVVSCGFFGMTAYQLLLNWGELDVPAETASVIVAAAPLISIGVAVVAFGEKMSLVRVGGSVVALAGVALVCLARSGLSLSGSVLVVVAAMVAQGLYQPLTKPLLKKYTGLEVATYAMVAGTVLTLPSLPFGWSALLAADRSAWIAAIYLGLLPSALGFVLWGYAVARLPVSTSTSLLYLVTAAAILIAYVWLHEIPLLSEVSGGLVVILGVVVVSQGDRLIARLRGQGARPGPAVD